MLFLGALKAILFGTLGPSWGRLKTSTTFCFHPRRGTYKKRIRTRDFGGLPGTSRDFRRFQCACALTSGDFEGSRGLPGTSGDFQGLLPKTSMHFQGLPEASGESGIYLKGLPRTSGNRLPGTSGDFQGLPWTSRDFPEFRDRDSFKTTLRAASVYPYWSKWNLV